MTGRCGTRWALGGVLVAVLAACGGPAAAPPEVSATPGPESTLPPGVTPVDDRFTPDVPAELRVADPDDMRGIDPCTLLSSTQLTELGLDPGSGRRNDVYNGPGCAWFDRDDTVAAQLDVQTDPSGAKLPDLWKLRDNLHNVEILHIAGHPVLRGEDEPTGGCGLAVGIADDQLLGLEIRYLDGRAPPEPCATARRMAELVLSNLAAR